MKKISADTRQYFKSPLPSTQEAALLQELGQSCTPTDTYGNSECNDAKFSISSDVRYQYEKFITSGFNKWKKLTEALKSHDSSQNHNKCFEKYVAHEQDRKGSPFEVKGKLYQKISYTSPKIQNELIETTATVMKEEISKRIHKSGMFSIIVDEARSRDFTSLAAAITDVLNDLHVESMVMVAQLYGGVSVISGKHNGVQAKIKEEHPQATIFTAWLTDKPSAHSKFLEVQKLCSLRTTRWNCRYKNCRYIIANFEAVVQALSEELEEGKGKDVMTAMGILSSIKTQNFIVCLFTMDYVLSLMNVLSNCFQKEEATLGASARLVKSTLATLQEQRDKFDDVWIPIEKFAEEHYLTLSAPKSIKEKKAKYQDYIQLAIMIPECSAGAERSFSAMWRVKIWLRSTTGQQRFSSLSLIHIEEALLKEIGPPLECDASYAHGWGRERKPARHERDKATVSASHMSRLHQPARDPAVAA
ncbi:hypothetical protein PR048_031835 [Dryococelus australis]|uniref:Transposase n=1 Tax=Dryococelus australis TaxID=614101 RepID=A0ABQ9G6F6_9NEOP|nr:hypothetical protein PR048_031835 [Dryococelus australis]